MTLCVLRNPKHQIDIVTNEATLRQVNMSTLCIYITNVKSYMINEVVVKGMTCRLGSKPSLKANVCACNHEANVSLGCFARVLMPYKGHGSQPCLALALESGVGAAPLIHYGHMGVACHVSGRLASKREKSVYSSSDSTLNPN